MCFFLRRHLGHVILNICRGVCVLKVIYLQCDWNLPEFMEVMHEIPMSLIHSGYTLSGCVLRIRIDE